MIVRLAIAAVVVVVVVVITQIVNRRRTLDGPTVTGTELPAYVDRNDFVSPAARHLVVVFSAEHCLACVDVWSWVQTLESADVAVQDVEASRDRDLHRRYRIDSVPATLVIDTAGVVTQQVLGPIGPAEQASISKLLDAT